MAKPSAQRRADVESKLAYAKYRHQDVMNTLFFAKKSSTDPAFLVHSFGDIISAARECFDYLGQDIIEGYIVPRTANSKISKAFTDGSLKAYFPYFTNQFTKTDSLFYELKSHTPALYKICSILRIK